MDLHLHLSAAFRALDREWGIPVDLDTSGEAYPCLPAVVERPTITFSSEIFLKKVRRNRPKPYSRTEDRRRKSNVKLNDSFSNISVSRLHSYGEEDQKSFDSIPCGANTCERLMGEMEHLIKDLKKPLEETLVVLDVESSRTTHDFSSEGKYQINKVLKELKAATLSYIGKKLKKKVNVS